MDGKVALVTGASSGIGFFTALGLARRGASVIITGRDVLRGEAARRAIERGSGNAHVFFLAVDHAQISENLQLADRVAERWRRLDVLVNNVGGMPGPGTDGAFTRIETSDGYEATLATNFLAPFALTDALLRVLEASGPSRVVNVTSSAHSLWQSDPFEDLELRTSYVAIEAYARAKLLNLLWTFALARRLRLRRSRVVVNATNPGMAWTAGTQALTRDAVPGWRVTWPIVRWLQRRASPERAARSSLELAAGPALSETSGVYLESNGKRALPSRLALEPDYQEGAFAVGLRLVANAPSQAPSWRRTA